MPNQIDERTESEKLPDLNDFFMKPIRNLVKRLSSVQQRVILASGIGVGCLLVASMIPRPAEEGVDDFIIRLDRESRETSTAKSWRKTGMFK